MALSTLEKVKLQRQYKDKRFAVSTAKTIEKVKLLREAKELLAQLKGEQVTTTDSTPPQNQKLADLLAGKYDDLKPEAYQVVLKDVYDEINAVDPLKPAIITYLDKTKAKGIISESAEAELLKLLEE